MSQLPDAQIEAASGLDPLLLEDDYFKHLSTIALVKIGALLTWLQSGRGTTLVMISITLVAISAMLAFSAMNQIINHRKTGKPMRAFFRWERFISTGTFASGLGMTMSEVGKVIH